MAKPTAKQVAFLQSHGISPPNTDQKASSIITYLTEGNGAGEEKTLADRLARFEVAKYEFVGLLVLSTDGQRGPYEVLEIFPKTPHQVALIKKKMGEDDPPINPFDFSSVEAGQWAKEGTVQGGDLAGFCVCDQRLGEVKNLGWSGF